MSGWVLVGGALVASPALKDALVDGTMPVATAGVRLAVALVVVWVGVSMLEWLLSRTAEPTPEEPEVPRALPGIDGPVTVRPASIDTPVDPPSVRG
jgi:hypothetical protein